MPAEVRKQPPGCEVAILAGGAGTRLKSRTGSLPKPMAPILGEPVLAHLLALCRQHGFLRVALLVHYEHQAISEHFGDGSRHGLQLSYHVEREARGTAGALHDALPFMAERFLVLYGDTYADVDLRRVWQHHIERSADATLLLHPNDHPGDSDLVEVDGAGRVVAVHAYPHPAGETHANLVNAALYVMQRHGLERYMPATGKADLAKHSFPAMLRAGCHLQGLVTPEYIKDMGTPDRLDKVERDIVFGLPERLSTRQPRAAVFLDRDGTLNVEVGHLSDAAHLRLLPGAAKAVRDLNRAGRLAVCLTNQPVLARGDVTPAQLQGIHATLDHLLGQEHAYLDRLYFCPHHPDRGFAGEVPELKVACDCRKPGTGMFDRAVRELDIDRGASWMVGDTTIDMRAGRRAGVRTVLVRTGQAGRDRKHPEDRPDYIVPDLAAAVHWILTGHAAMTSCLLPVAAAAVSARLVLVAGPARAGKSAAARVLAELLSSTGRRVHVVCADGWLRPVDQRQEGQGVLARYDMAALTQSVVSLLPRAGRKALEVPIYDRDSRVQAAMQHVSIGPDDLLIVEGVTTLMVPELVGAASVRIFVSCPEDVREKRLQEDYACRQPLRDDLDALLRSRAVDELPSVLASAMHATHLVESK